jgi:HMG (high mobility group) box
MPSEEKELWEKKARKDKARYEVEKAMYKGPWKIPANKRTPKDPTAPKRPMSAFLAFSNKRRAALKREHPNATNADLSKMLSQSWKEAPDDIRSKYVEEEASLRSHYKTEMGKWRKKMAEEKKLERQEREAIAMEAAETRQPHEGSGAPIAVPPDPRQYSRPVVDHGMNGPQLDHHQPHHDPSGLGPPGPPGPGGMYGNPYGMGGEYGYGAMPPNTGHMGYGNMPGANPFGAQPLMGGQSHFMSHLFSKFSWCCQLYV